MEWHALPHHGRTPWLSAATKHMQSLAACAQLAHSPQNAHERELLLFLIERINHLHTAAQEVAHIAGGQG